MSERPFRFGVMARATSVPQMLATAKRAEEMGYTTFQMADHFTSEMAPLVSLAAIATNTSRIRVGTLVLDNDFRHPAVLAKEVATLDAISGGRLELGIGAGWVPADYEQSGIPFEKPGVRLDRMVEGIQIIRGFTSQDKTTFAGNHYQVTELAGRPASMQRPVPIMIGGSGPRLLRIAGQHADIVNISSRNGKPRFKGFDPNDVEGTSYPLRIQRLREASGDRYVEVAGIVWHVGVGTDRQKAIEEVAARTDSPVEKVTDGPGYLAGTVESIADQMEWQRAEFGFTYYTVTEPDMEQFAPVVARLSGK